MKRYARLGFKLGMVLWLGIALGGTAQADDLQDADKLMEEQNFTAATAIYQRMADAGDIRALNMLAVIYWRGAGVERSIDKALEYAIRVDQQASTPHSQGFISMLYMSKTPSDDAASYTWLKKATSTEVVPGLFFRLARYYESGTGITANKERAYVWYLMSMMSAEADMDKYRKQKLMAQTKISEIESALSDERVKTASELAENCFKSRSEACY